MPPANRGIGAGLAGTLRKTALWAAASWALIMAAGNPAYAQVISSADFCDGSVRKVDSTFVSVTSGDVFTYVGGVVSIFIDGSSVYDLDALGSVTAKPSEDGKVFEFRTDGPAEIRCTPSATAPSSGAGNSAAQASITVQAGVTQTAISTNLAGRFGGAGISVGPSNIVVSTRGLDNAIAQLGEPDLNAWIAVDARRFSGASTGNSRNLTLGFDHLVSPDLVIGGFAGVNDQTVTEGGLTTDTLAPLYGVYAAHRYRENLYLSGYVGIGQPRYTTGAITFTAQRRVLGLSLMGDYQTGNLRLSPTTTILASQEVMPPSSGAADTLHNLQAKFGLRAQPAQRLANGMLPYASLAIEYREQGSDLAGIDRFVQPRLGLGFDWALAAGSLRADLDYGAVNSGTNDLGVSVIYDFKF
jgi:hypothetical protein